MAVDRYTKVVLTVIAVCLVWLSFGGSPATPVSAQSGERVLLAGWVDEKGNIVSFPAPSPVYELDSFGRPTSRTSPRAQFPLPTAEQFR
jgi:hypothetical protein